MLAITKKLEYTLKHKAEENMKRQTRDSKNIVSGKLCKVVLIGFLLYCAWLGGQVVHYVENIEYYLGMSS